MARAVQNTVADGDVVNAFVERDLRIFRNDREGFTQGGDAVFRAHGIAARRHENRDRAVRSFNGEGFFRSTQRRVVDREIVFGGDLRAEIESVRVDADTFRKLEFIFRIEVRAKVQRRVFKFHAIRSHRQERIQVFQRINVDHRVGDHVILAHERTEESAVFRADRRNVQTFKIEVRAEFHGETVKIRTHFDQFGEGGEIFGGLQNVRHVDIARSIPVKFFIFEDRAVHHAERQFVFDLFAVDFTERALDFDFLAVDHEGIVVSVDRNFRIGVDLEVHVLEADFLKERLRVFDVDADRLFTFRHFGTDKRNAVEFHRFGTGDGDVGIQIDGRRAFHGDFFDRLGFRQRVAERNDSLTACTRCNVFARVDFQVVLVDFVPVGKGVKRIIPRRLRIRACRLKVGDVCRIRFFHRLRICERTDCRKHLARFQRFHAQGSFEGLKRFVVQVHFGGVCHLKLLF